MPIVKIEMLAGRDVQTKQAIATEVTAVISKHLGNDPAHIYVMFDDVASEDWAVGGRLFANMAEPSSDKE